MKLGNRSARFAFQTHSQPTSTLIHPLDGLKLIFSSLTSVTRTNTVLAYGHPLKIVEDSARPCTNVSLISAR